MTRKPLRFNAFVMNTNSHIHHGQWQRPEAQQTEFTDVNTWINVAHHKAGCSWGLNPPVSSSDLTM